MRNGLLTRFLVIFYGNSLQGLKDKSMSENKRPSFGKNNGVKQSLLMEITKGILKKSLGNIAA